MFTSIVRVMWQLSRAALFSQAAVMEKFPFHTWKITLPPKPNSLILGSIVGEGGFG